MKDHQEQGQVNCSVREPTTKKKKNTTHREEPLLVFPEHSPARIWALLKVLMVVKARWSFVFFAWSARTGSGGCSER
ncbi:hypothetical protein Ddc_13940 [Ditylenchus destructor]|nr:hypothetical protein Ddc_13940 [Ditylenchus destructor]